MLASVAMPSRSRRTRRGRTWGPRIPTGAPSLGVVLALASLLGARTAHAGGFEIPDTGARAAGRGGAMVAGADDLTALHYNPGALARQRGTNFLYNHNLTFHRTTFARAPLRADVWGIDRDFEPVSDRRKVFPLGLFAVVSSDFGLRNWTFAAGVYGPSAVGRHDYPTYGAQAFQLTSMDVLLAYYNVAAAWKLRDVFGVGVTVQYVDMLQMKYALVVDSRAVSTLNPTPDSMGTQLETQLNLKDRTAATAQVGLWYRPHRRVELGLASRVIPVYLRPEGGVRVDKPMLVTGDIHVSMPLVLPATMRGGVRYIHDDGSRKWFDLELDVVYENWSSIESFDLDITGAISGQALSPLKIDKKWKDTVSVRLGGDFFALPPYLTVRAGGYVETPTQDREHAHLDFPAFLRGAVGAGLTAGAKGVYATLGYMHVFQQTQNVSEAQGQVFQQRPLAPCPAECDGLSGVPANAGRLQSSFDLLNLGFEIRFGELLAGRKARRAAAKGQREGAPVAAPQPAPAPAERTPAEPLEVPTEPTPEPADGLGEAGADAHSPPPATSPEEPSAASPPMRG
jgi:long-chain fatty acid transport protein